MITQYNHTITIVQNIIKSELAESSDVAAFANALGVEINAVEQALVQISTMASIDDSVGVQLDIVGRLLVQSRAGGLDDADYRTLLKGTCLAIQASGTISQLHAIIDATDPSNTHTLVPEFPANLSMHVLTPVLTYQTALIRAQLFGRAKVAGVGFFFIWRGHPAANMFKFAPSGHSSGVPAVIDSNHGFTAGHLAGLIKV